MACWHSFRPLRRWSPHMRCSPTRRRSTITWPSSASFFQKARFRLSQDQVGRVLSKGDMKLGGDFLASLLLAIWSANGGMKAIIDALNVVYDEKEKRGFFKLNAVSLAFTVGGCRRDPARDRACRCAPVILSMIGLQSLHRLAYPDWPLAAAGLLLLLGLAVLIPLRPEPPIAEMAVDFASEALWPPSPG